MNAIFHDMIGKFMEVYIDDVVVKSATKAKHLADLMRSFERMRAHGLKMNPFKCAFGVTARNFLGFLVHWRGIEVDKNKARAIIEAQPPRNKKELQRLIGKWSLALMEFSFQYVPQRAVKGQALADFLADHPCLDVDPRVYDAMELCFIQLTPWTLIFDGSSVNDVGGAGIVIVAPNGRKTTYSFFLDFKCSNNQAEYESLIIGLGILLEMGAQTVEIIGDSSLVIGQLSSNFRCQSWHLKPFHSIAMQLLQEFADVKVKHVYRSHNKEANDLAQIASSVRVPKGIMENLIRIKKRSLPSVKVREELLAEVFAIEVEEDIEENDWRTPIVNFLKNPDPKADRKLKIKALKFVMIDGDLFRKSIKDDLLLRCVSKKEAMKVMGETHEGICGAHQAGIKMKWLIRRYAYYWPEMLKDCFTYAKGCQACQRHGPIHRAPAIELQPIIKPWPFRGWAMDLIGKVYSPSSKQHCFIIVVTDYFTK
ncbi:uncharacterized protein LOC132316573 [Cornus florida]|uniref:uncharacterized protein LOC132316573 n=1 Tax=Cornus florida TaxID=4283 RepID=UPI00289638CE|nr:uncharacterized protein LOC132316573 [Cornus florida]